LVHHPNQNIKQLLNSSNLAGDIKMAGNLQFKSAIVACVLSLIIFAQPGVSADEKAPAGVLKWKAGIGNPDQGGSQAELSAAGNERFRYGTGDEIWWPMVPAIGGDGTIYVGSNDNNLYAINPDGTEKWSYPTGSDVNSPPAVGSDGTIYFGSHDNKVYALNPDGTLKWSYQTGDAVSAHGTIIYMP
jgi:outer membrane protein assembly factor BamB